MWRVKSAANAYRSDRRRGVSEAGARGYQGAAVARYVRSWREQKRPGGIRPFSTVDGCGDRPLVLRLDDAMQDEVVLEVDNEAGVFPPRNRGLADESRAGAILSSSALASDPSNAVPASSDRIHDFERIRASQVRSSRPPMNV
jgi:hypothetical protein